MIKDIRIIERIITKINELKIITTGKDEKYFCDGSEMIILCEIVSYIERRIKDISSQIKAKYPNVNWDIIKNERKKNRENDFKIGSVLELSMKKLHGQFYRDLVNILNVELPIYSKEYTSSLVKY